MKKTCIDLIGERCHLPDHYILMLTFKVGVQKREVGISVSQTKIRYRTFPKNVLSSNMCRSALLEFIGQLVACKSTQSSVDRW